RDFQKKLSEKVKATHEAFLKDRDNYSCYLKNFDGFKPERALNDKEVGLMQYMESEFGSLRTEIENSIVSLKREVHSLKTSATTPSYSPHTLASLGATSAATSLTGLYSPTVTGSLAPANEVTLGTRLFG
ncbi:MAG: hypothetical protein ACKO8Z_18575, partial [Prosthecobacter sp.]